MNHCGFCKFEEDCEDSETKQWCENYERREKKERKWCENYEIRKRIERNMGMTGIDIDKEAKSSMPRIIMFLVKLYNKYSRRRL